MANPQGFPIWYELMTRDPAGTKAFYDEVIGWTISDKSDQPGMDYRMIATADGEMVGGVFTLSQENIDGGAAATWLFYIGVDDVDATAAKIRDKGGTVQMEPFDIPGAGRAALVNDPQGNPFYIMRGSSDGTSTAFDRMGMGKCNWNELATSDQAAGNAFYSDVFGWDYPDKMAMPGEMGDYVFVAVGDQTIGATMKAAPGQPTGWRFYFRTPDIEDTAAKVGKAGGMVMMGPQEVPGGDRIIVAADAQGIGFGAVGPANS